VVKENHLTTREQVTHYTKAGGGCESCHPKIEAILARIGGEEVKKPPPPPPAKRKMTNLQKIKLVQEALEREIIPPMRADGGDLELIDMDGNTVYVALRGTCSFCPSSEFTLKKYVESKLRELVSPDIVLREVKP